MKRYKRRVFSMKKTTEIKAKYSIQFIIIFIIWFLAFFLTTTAIYAASADIPMIGKVSNSITLYSDNTTAITICEIEENEGILRAWAKIIMPDGRSHERNLQENSTGCYMLNDYEFNIEGTYVISFFVIDVLGNISPPCHTTVIKKPASHKKAIIIKGPAQETQLKHAIHQTSLAIVNYLKNSGLNEDEFICLGESPIIGHHLPLTTEGLIQSRKYIENTQDVFIFIAGTGKRGQILLNGIETIQAKQIMSWMDKIQSIISGNLIIIADLNSSGHLLRLNREKYSGRRLIISSTNINDENSFFVDGQLIFTDLYLQQISLGAPYGKAFEQLSSFLNWSEINQHSVIDTNGNGIANESIDIEMANDISICNDLAPVSNNRPLIQKTTLPELIASDFAEISVEVSSSIPVETVYAIIAYPKSNDLSRPLKYVPLVHNEQLNHYETQLSQITTFGVYDIAIIALDKYGNASLPYYTQIKRSGDAPDAFEIDDNIENSKYILLSTYSKNSTNNFKFNVQHRNFHHEADVDWVKMICQKDEWYQLTIKSVGKNCDYVIRIYDADGQRFIKTNTPNPDFDIPYKDRGEIAQWQSKYNGIYYARISQCMPSDYPDETDVCENLTKGEDTEYLLTFFCPYLNYDAAMIVQVLQKVTSVYFVLSGKITYATKVMNASLFSLFSLAIDTSDGNQGMLIVEAENYPRYEEPIAVSSFLDKQVTKIIDLNSIVTPPLADFSASQTKGKEPLTVNFQDLSRGTINQRIWYFGDQYTSTTQHPQHIYTKTGTYNVSLFVSGTGGEDIKVVDDMIIVEPAEIIEPLPDAFFMAHPDHGTAPLNVQFENQSTGKIDSYLWNFGDQQTAISKQANYTYTTDGIYTASLNVKGPGGSDTHHVTIRVDPMPVMANFFADITQGDAPHIVQFTDQSTGNILKWQWNFGDGQANYEKNPVHSYQKPGTYSVSLTVFGKNNQNTKTIQQMISISHPLPVAKFIAYPRNGDGPLNVSFMDRSLGTIKNWIWDFGDGQKVSGIQNPEHEYQASLKPYDITLTVTGPGGEDTITMNEYIMVNPQPIYADFSMNLTTGTTPLTVMFTDLSKGPVSYWYWDFGDNSFSWETNPVHEYKTPGTYSIVLKINDNTGELSKTKQYKIVVLPPPPDAKFLPEIARGTGELEVQFTDLSTEEISQWLWDFGDGIYSDQQHPVHLYEHPGNCYDVRLTVQGPGGSDTKFVSDHTCIQWPAPIADFTTSQRSGSFPVKIKFSDKSKNSIDNYLWSFGDGTQSIEQSPEHIYTSEGKYTVILSVKGPGGNDVMIKSDLIHVYAPLFASYEIDTKTGIVPLEIFFNNTSQGIIDQCLWNFGDGIRSNKCQPRHIYEKPGIYTVLLEITGPDGTQKSVQKNAIQVLPDDHAATSLMFERKWHLDEQDFSWGSPGAMAKDINGNIYVIDNVYHRLCLIQHKDQNNIYKVLTNDLNLPSGIAVSDDNIFVSDAGNHCIKKFNLSGKSIATWGKTGIHEGELIGPQGIAFDLNNLLYIADTGNRRVQIFDVNGQFIKVLAAPYLIKPVAIAFSSENNIFIADEGQNIVFQCNEQGDILQEFHVKRPSDIAILSADRLLVIDKDNHQIVFLDVNTGDTISVSGSYGYEIGQFKQPDDILKLSDQCFLVSDSGNRRIQIWDSKFSLFSGSNKHEPESFSMISDLAVNDEAQMFIADYEKDKISAYTRSGKKLGQWGSSGQAGGQFNGPFALLIASNNHIYIADSGNHRIQVFDTYGNYLFQWGTKGIALGEFHFPTHLTADKDNAIYVVDTFNHRIQKFSSNGNPLISWGQKGTETGYFRFPLGIAYDGLDKIYVADFGNNRIQVFTTNGQYVSHRDLTANRFPSSLSYNNINASVFCLFTDEKIIQEFHGNTPASSQNLVISNGIYTSPSCTQFQNVRNTTIMFPFNTQTDSSGRLYIADAHQNKIYTFRRLYLKDISGMLKLLTNMKQYPVMTFYPDTDNDGYSNWSDFMEVFQGFCCQ